MREILEKVICEYINIVGKILINPDNKSFKEECPQAIDQALSQMKAKLLGELPKEKELSKHDQHHCVDEWCYTCNEGLSEEEYAKFWRASAFNDCLSQVKEIIEREFK